MKKTGLNCSLFLVPGSLFFNPNTCVEYQVFKKTQQGTRNKKQGTKRLLWVLVAIIFVFPILQGKAQMNTGESRQALQQIQGFFLHVDVEGSVGLTQDDALNVTAIKRRVTTRLRDAGLNVLETIESIDQAMEPYLYVHVNMMEMERGLVPFAVNTQFYQRVELPRQPRQSLIACTWDTGLVGLVSYDNLDMIADSAVESVTNFIADFRDVNP